MKDTVYRPIIAEGLQVEGVIEPALNTERSRGQYRAYGELKRGIGLQDRTGMERGSRLTCFHESVGGRSGKGELRWENSGEQEHERLG